MAEVVNLMEERTRRSGAAQTAPEVSRVTPSLAFICTVELYTDEQGEVIAQVVPTPSAPCLLEPDGLRYVAAALTRGASALFRGADDLERDLGPADA